MQEAWLERGIKLLPKSGLNQAEIYHPVDRKGYVSLASRSSQHRMFDSKVVVVA